jgi:hypothetical protein
MDPSPQRKGVLEPSQPFFSGEIASEAPVGVTLGTFGEGDSSVKPNPFGTPNQPMLQGGPSPMGQIVQPSKKPFRWMQFFLGLTLPIVIVIIVSILAGQVNQNSWENAYFDEMHVLSPDSNGHYSKSIEMKEGHLMEYCSISKPSNSGGDFSDGGLYCTVDHQQADYLLEVFQEKEYIPTIEPTQLTIDEANGTLSLSFNGTFEEQPGVYGSIYTDSGNFVSNFNSQTTFVSNEQNGSFNHSFPPQSESLDVYLMLNFYEHSEYLQIDYRNSRNYQESGDQTAILQQEGHYIFTGETGWRDGDLIGEYTLRNSTLWFVPNGSMTNDYFFEIQIYDERTDDANYFWREAVNGSFCCMPLVYLGAIIMAFVRGNKGLGWGLVSSGAVAVFLIGAVIALLLATFSGF